MADTAIEWATKVWNPTTGCDKVSPGCDNCYALTMAKRLKGMGSAKYQTDGDPRTSGPGFGLGMHPDALSIPGRWRRPERVFVNSMSDLFHPKVTDEFLCRVFDVMATHQRHVFQVLTKRPPRARAFLRRYYAGEFVDDPTAGQLIGSPLPNVWLGTSVENQAEADRRIPVLLGTPAAVRWISAEPLLGPVDLQQVARVNGSGGGWIATAALGHGDGVGVHLDWVVTGGESGHGARPAHPNWFRSLRDQCMAAGVAYLHKQNGEHVWEWRGEKAGWQPRRVGKKAAGRELDGRTWDEYPGALPRAARTALVPLAVQLVDELDREVADAPS